MEANKETVKYAEYKGRKYKLLFLGDTRHGKRAKLAFLDGSKEFWVPANLLNNSNVPEDEENSSPTMPFGKYKGEAFAEIPTDYLEWLVKRDNLREPLRTTVTKELEGREDRSGDVDDSDIPF
jgi:hypothetical protein